jgi:hypothetical protein
MTKIESWVCKCGTKLNKNTVLNITGMFICPVCFTKQPDKESKK